MLMLRSPKNKALLIVKTRYEIHKESLTETFKVTFVYSSDA